MSDIIAWISQYTEFYPLVAIILLLLASLSIPLSEDLIIITGALLCRGDPSMLIPTFAALYCGVIMSDYIPYTMGKYIRKGTLKSNFFTRLFSQRRLDKMHHYLEKFGIFTFIVCRFIPFGVRNTLFMSSGFFGLRLRRFAVFDLTAATINVSTLFFLVYHFGEAIEKPFQVVGKILFVLVLSAFIFIAVRIIRRMIFKRKNARNKQVDVQQQDAQQNMSVDV
jgi:membrane protein DedA with SNARE-associated domain